MFVSTRHIVVFVLLCCVARGASAQSVEIHGQASGWTTGHPAEPAAIDGGLRYIPDLLAGTELGGGIQADMELSLNAFADTHVERYQRPVSEADLKLYRAWLRIASESFEARLGLQKINFGSAMLFRPLMWFDRIDPRDPLQLTDGVYGLLLRYYFPSNANLWAWGLYGNDDPKGWEQNPTARRTVELGGRAQARMLTGEIGFTYHHRQADLSMSVPPAHQNVPEDRIGLDGKWDIGAGVWVEASLARQRPEDQQEKYQRLWTIGADYTITIGNGLYAAAEYGRFENPEVPFGPAEGTEVTGITARYPIGILDQVSAMVFRDWTLGEWYTTLTWQRTYDEWAVYLLGFWNPDTIRLYQGGSGTFAGKGLQLIVVFNH